MHLLKLIQNSCDILRAFPDHVVRAPYSVGWLVEFSPTDPEDAQCLIDASLASASAERDLRRFRAAVARSILGDGEGELERRVDSGLEPDLRCLFGGRDYVGLLRTLVH